MPASVRAQRTGRGSGIDQALAHAEQRVVSGSEQDHPSSIEGTVQ
jgi:hypothetical protein